MQDRFNYLYERLNGFIIEEESGGIPNLFDGECGRLYGLVYDARVRISKVLDETLDGENADVMIIVNAMERITKIIAEQLYRYGYDDGLICSGGT